MPARSSRSVAVEHVRIETTKSIQQVKAALEALLPTLNAEAMTRVREGDAAEAASELDAFAELSIFQTRDHGAVLRAAGGSGQALQYEIGNPLTASSMTRYRRAAALYAPLRVVLYETDNHTSIFEYDLPSSLFGQFEDDRVAEVGRKLDRQLETALLQAAS
jgi:uncharacterized protein (DUF302 family)